MAPSVEHRQVPEYRDEVGWVRLDELIDADRAAELAARCSSLADRLGDPGSGDKPHGGTRRLAALASRLPEIDDLLEGFAPVVDQILTGGWSVDDVAWRCPGPGFGAQRLHADDLPLLEPGPDRCATAIVALVDFTAENGSTRVVPGSHRRPDLQRSAGSLDHHPDEVSLIGPAGAGFVFSGHLLHSGTENRSTEPRPAIQITYRARSTPGGPGAP